MSGWEAYLPQLEVVSDASAIISLQGALCGKKGNWKANQAEMSHYAALMNQPYTAQSKGLTYGGTKYIVIRATDDTIVAQLHTNGLVLQKSNTVFVVGHYVEGQVCANVAAKTDAVVRLLQSANV